MGNKDRGFASLPAEKQRALASKGGKAAHQKGAAHEWNSEDARAAGKLGGLKRAENARKARAERVA